MSDLASLLELILGAPRLVGVRELIVERIEKLGGFLAVTGFDGGVRGAEKRKWLEAEAGIKFQNGFVALERAIEFFPPCVEVRDVEFFFGTLSFLFRLKWSSLLLL